MEIQAIFEKSFSGPPGDAVWIVESASNRNWFASAKRNLDPNSAIFSLERYRSVDHALCHVVWGIKDHFPRWQSIHVLGLPPALLIPAEMEQEGRWVRRPDGLVLHRE
ncbi:hypothetical protein [Salipiger abyssi]|uniref:hypothetical protein n=1 Tax=Salipiger abyssi TaxID=1250539 RepID=UPI0040594C4B